MDWADGSLLRDPIIDKAIQNQIERGKPFKAAEWKSGVENISSQKNDYLIYLKVFLPCFSFPNKYFIHKTYMDGSDME